MKRVALAALAAALVLMVVPGAGATTRGRQLWVARYDDRSHKNDAAAAAAISLDGSTIFVTGYGQGASDSDDFVTIAYDPSTGAPRWVARYDGPFHGSDAAGFIKMSPDGSTLFVAGSSFSGSNNYDWATVAYDASTGARLWAARYGGPANFRDSLAGLGVSPDGSSVFVTGSSTGVGTKYDFATIAYDASTGTREWVTRYNRVANSKDVVTGLAVSADGSTVFVAGTSALAEHPVAVTIAYKASNGTQRWIATFGGPLKRAYAASIVATPDGSRVIVFGGEDQSSHVVAYDPSSGAKIWVRRYAHHGSGVGGASSTTSPDGSTVFIASAAGQPARATTVAIDASNGARLWTSHYAGPGSSAEADAVVCSMDGSMVFTTGASNDRARFLDYATVAYDASSGARLWTRLYSGPGGSEDIARSVVASPDGSRVFVTGTSGGESHPDFATVAYAS